MIKRLSCLVFGATGLVGQQLVELLSKDERYSEIHIANRSEKQYSSAKIKQRLIDFEKLSTYQDLFMVNQVFICLGTTINKAGSKAAFEKVDLEYPTQIAKLSKEKGVDVLVHISALGANSSSSNFYSKTKGRAEEAIMELGSKANYAVRPSILFGDREEKRLGESIGKVLMKNLEFLMIGGLKKYRGIYDVQVAKAMITIANEQPKHRFYNSEELKLYAKK